MSFHPRRVGRDHEYTPDNKKESRRLSRDDFRSFLRILAYVRPYRFWFTISIIALLFSVALGLVLPLVIQSLVDIVLVDKDLQLLNQLALGLMAVFILQALFSFAHRLSLAYVGERAIADIRNEVYDHVMHLSLKFFNDRRTGELVSRVTNDVSLLQVAITDNLVALLRQVVTLLGASVLLLWLNWQLTVVILIGIPIVSLTMVFLGRRIRMASKQVQDQLAEAANVLEETVSGVRIVKSFAREPYEIGRFGERVLATYEAAMYRAKIQAILAPIIGFMAFASIVTTLWIGSYQVIAGTLTAGGLVAYLVYTMLVATPIATLAGLYGQFLSAVGASERLLDLLDTESDIKQLPDAQPLPSIIGQVAFEGVSFHYGADMPVLRHIHFTAEPGQIVALVGPSGAGKSTLVNLIPRFYDVVEGAILIDDFDVRDIRLDSLRQQIGILPQETVLFSATVRENIRYGRLEATAVEIEAAARAANAHDFILNDLPHGYETTVGERGIKLSGGQRQRIAIARAILKDPRILILDEATSSLDSESERLVQDALDRLMAGRTSFVIAHRLSTVVNADWVLVLDKGEIVEQGTHATLLANPDGLYARLHAMQFRLEEI